MTTTTTSLGVCQYDDDCTQPAVEMFDDEIVGATPICKEHADAAEQAAAADAPPVDRLEQQTRDLLAKGKPIQYICDLTGYSRQRVEQLVGENRTGRRFVVGGLERRCETACLEPGDERLQASR